MPKKRSTRLGRLAILFMAVMGQINVILLTALLVTESTTDFQLRILPAMRATAWHMRNGNTVTYDGHRFHLPASWYPTSDDRTGALDLHYAPLGSVSLDEIHLVTEPKLDEHALKEQFAKAADHLNQRSSVPDQWRLETLQGRKLTYRCMASDDEFSHILNCHAADSNLRFVVLVGAKSRAAALNILETSE